MTLPILDTVRLEFKTGGKPMAKYVALKKWGPVWGGVDDSLMREIFCNLEKRIVALEKKVKL